MGAGPDHPAIAITPATQATVEVVEVTMTAVVVEVATLIQGRAPQEQEALAASGLEWRLVACWDTSLEAAAAGAITTTGMAMAGAKAMAPGAEVQEAAVGSEDPAEEVEGHSHLHRRRRRHREQGLLRDSAAPGADRQLLETFEHYCDLMCVW